MGAKHGELTIVIFLLPTYKVARFTSGKLNISIAMAIRPTYDARFLVCMLLLCQLALISIITSEPVQSQPAMESLKSLSSVNESHDDSRKQQRAKIFIPRRKTIQSSVEEFSPALESSIVSSSSESNLKIFHPKLWMSLFNNRQSETSHTTNTGCTCSDPNPSGATFGRVCSTTCLISETLCDSQAYTRTTTLSILFSLFTGLQIQGGLTFDISYLSTTQMTQIDDSDCELLESQCIARTALTQAKVTGALAAGAAIGLSVGIITDKKSKSTEEKKEDEEEEEYYQELEYPEKLNRKSRSNFENLKSSMIPMDEQLDVVPRRLIDFVLRRKAQPAIGTCICSVSIPLLFQQECSTTCLSSERLCGNNFCTRTSVFNAFLYPTGGNNELTTQTFLSVNNKDCEILKADCIASSAVFVVAKVGAVAGLAAAALSSGMGLAAKIFLASNNQNNRTENVDDPLRSNNMRRRAKEVKYFDFALRGNSSFVDETIETSPILESSIVQENNLKRLPRNNLFGLFGGRQGGGNTLPKCTCDDPSPSAGTIGRACSTICRNSETLCSGSRTCYRSTTFMAIYSLLTGSSFYGLTLTRPDSEVITSTIITPISSILTRKYSQIDEKRCEILESQCSAADSIAKARQSTADVAALSVGLTAGAVGISLIKAKYSERNNETYEEYDYYSQDHYKRQKRRRRMLSIKERKQIEIQKWRNSLQKNEFDPPLSTPSVESSMQEELNVPNFLKFSGRQAEGCVCNIVAGLACTTTCFSSVQPCTGGCNFCTLTCVFEARNVLIGVTSSFPGGLSPVFSTLSFLTVDIKDCEKLLVDCSIASSAIAAAGTVAAIAAGVGGGLSAGIAVAAVVFASNNNQQNDTNNNNTIQQLNQLANQTPANNLPFPVIGLNFPDDGSGESSVRFPDGNIYSIFSRGPCNQTNQWVTVDPISLQVSRAFSTFVQS